MDNSLKYARFNSYILSVYFILKSVKIYDIINANNASGGVSYALS